MVPEKRILRTFAGLRRVVATLRGPNGCPWDRAQTHESLRPYLLEEASEALDALHEGDTDKLQEELGDLLLEVLLHIQIAEEQGEFSLSDVILGISDKLVRRHPHVFSNAVAETPEEVVEQWDELKRLERDGQSALTGIPDTLPALASAQALQRRAERAGFAFESLEQVWDALHEELGELRAAETEDEKRAEAGDALFALANLVRWLGADAEDALRSTSRGFTASFQRLEGLSKEKGLDLTAAGLADKLALWDEAKRGA